MAACSDVQLLAVIKDLHTSIQELSQGQETEQQPVTDSNPALHRLCTKLEFLLQYDQKEKKTILGVRKDYWDYFCVCLTSHKCGADALKFVHGTINLTTPLGRGRAFLRCCLVRQQLADCLHFSFLDQTRASDWYYARSPFLSDEMRWDIIEHLYTLNGLTFDLQLMDVDLDASWPTACWATKLHRHNGKRLVTCVDDSESSCKDEAQSSYRPTGWSGTLADKLTTFTRRLRKDSSNRKGSSKNASQDLVADSGAGDQRVTQGLREFQGADVDGRPPGEAETPNTSDNDRPPTASQAVVLGTSADSVQAQPHELGQQERTEGWQPLEGSHVGGQGKDQEVTGGQMEAEGSEGSQIERLKMDLQRKEDIIEELRGLLKEKEKVRVEECSRLQREVATLQRMQEEGLSRLGNLEDSNKFLNETVEEMDSVLDGLRQALATKEQENISLRREQAGVAAVARQVHLEETEKLRLELRGQQDVLGETGQVGGQDSKESTLGLVQSGKDVRSPPCLESPHESLEEQVGDLELSTLSPRPEAIGLRAPEGQSWNLMLLPNTTREASESLQGEARGIQTERGFLSQSLDGQSFAQEKSPLLDSLPASERERHQSQENISNLTQHLVRYKDRELSPREKSEVAATMGEDLHVLKDLLEELIPMLESTDDGKPEIELKMEGALGQVCRVAREMAGTGGRAVEAGDRDEVHVELGTTEDKEVERSDGDHSENGDTEREWAAAPSALDRSSRVKEQMEEIVGNGRRVRRLEEQIERLEAERQKLEEQREVLETKVSGLEEQLLRWSVEVGGGKEQCETEGAGKGIPAGSVSPSDAAACGQEAASVDQQPRGGAGMQQQQQPCSVQEETATAPHAPGNSQGSEDRGRDQGLENRDTELLALTTALAQAGGVERALREELSRASEDVERGEEERRELRDMVTSLKERTVQLIREKDEVWQRSAGLDSPPQPHPPDTPSRWHPLSRSRRL